MSAKSSPNNGYFLKTVITLNRALEDISDDQREEIETNPNDYLIIIPLGGGHQMFKQLELVRISLRDTLRHILSVNLVVGETRDIASKNICGRYRPPISFFVDGLSAAHRSFLTRFQTFGINTTLAFHVIPVNSSVQSWVVGIFKSGIPESSRGLERIRQAIMDSLFTDSKFRPLIAPARPGSKAMDIFAAEVLNTIMIRSVPGYQEPTYVVYLAPFGPSKEPFENAKQYIRAKAFQTPPYIIEPIGMGPPAALVVCTFCKMDQHHTSACLFASIEDWWGPRPSVATNHTTTVDGNSTAAKNHPSAREEWSFVVGQPSRNYPRGRGTGLNISGGRGRGQRGRGMNRGRGRGHGNW